MCHWNFHLSKEDQQDEWLENITARSSVVCNSANYKAKPSCSLEGKDFADKVVEREFTTKWKPIFKLMEQYPQFDTSQVADVSFV